LNALPGRDAAVEASHLKRSCQQERRPLFFSASRRKEGTMARKMLLPIAVGLCVLMAGAGGAWFGVATGRIRPGARIPVYVDGHLLRQRGLVLMGRTYLPLRSVAESLGLSLETYPGHSGIYLRSNRTGADETSAHADRAAD